MSHNINKQKMEFYRNTIDITSNEGIEIDAGSLWTLQNNELTLIDDDQHITNPLTKAFQPDTRISEA